MIAQGRPPTPIGGGGPPAHPVVRCAAAQDDPSCHRLNTGAALTLAMRSTVHTPRRHRFDVVDGSVRIYVGSYGWRAGQAAVIGGDDDAVWVDVVGLASALRGHG